MGIKESGNYSRQEKMDFTGKAMVITLSDDIIRFMNKKSTDWDTENGQQRS